jgi:hypothetical protein
MQCSGDIRKHPRRSKIKYFLKQFIQLAIQLKKIRPSEKEDLITKIF